MDIKADVKTGLETNHIIDVSDRLYKVVLAVIAGGVVLGVGALSVQFGSLPQNAPHEISVNGEGKAYAKPDVAVISFGAHTEAEKSQDAVSKNNDIVSKVITAVKESGVEDKDIQTTLYQLSPVYGYDNPVPTGAGKGGNSTMMYPYPGNQVIRGYALDQQIQVKIRNFDKINEILDKAAENGANTIGQLQFTVDDMEKVRSEARQKAITAAKEKAQSIFADSGLSGAKLVNISEGYSPYPMAYGKGMAVAPEAADVTAPQVQTGQLEIDTTVTLTYRVK